LAKRFLLVSLGLLALTLAYNIGASQTAAQSGVSFVGTTAAATSNCLYVFGMTASGDLYKAQACGAPYEFSYVGNFTGTSAISGSSLGKIKAGYRE